MGMIDLPFLGGGSATGLVPMAMPALPAPGGRGGLMARLAQLPLPLPSMQALLPPIRLLLPKLLPPCARMGGLVPPALMLVLSMRVIRVTLPLLRDGPGLGRPDSPCARRRSEYSLNWTGFAALYRAMARCFCAAHALESERYCATMKPRVIRLRKRLVSERASTTSAEPSAASEGRREGPPPELASSEPSIASFMAFHAWQVTGGT